MDKFAEFGPPAFFYLVALAAQLSGYTSLELAVVLVGLGTIWLVVSLLYRLHTRRIRAGKSGVEPSYLILFGLVGAALCLVVAAAGYGWQVLRPANSSAQSPTISQALANTQTTVFAKDQRVGRQYVGNPGPQDAVIYVARFAITGQHIRIYVEYAALSGPRAGGNSPTRLKIGDIRDFVRDDNIRITVISRNTDTTNHFIFRWGPDDGSGEIYDLGNYRGRILLLGDDGKEQYYYFVVTGGKLNDFFYPDVLSGETLSSSTTWGR